MGTRVREPGGHAAPDPDNLYERMLKPACASVASAADLARMAASLGRDHDLKRLPELRRIVELEGQLQWRLGRKL